MPDNGVKIMSDECRSNGCKWRDAACACGNEDARVCDECGAMECNECNEPEENHAPAARALRTDGEHAAMAAANVAKLPPRADLVNNRDGMFSTDAHVI
jgi:hypothetical protein